LAVFPVAPLYHQAEAKGIKFFAPPIGEDLLPTPEKLADLSGLENITMIGYPNGIWDEKNNMPIVRRGITATNPKHDYRQAEALRRCLKLLPDTQDLELIILKGHLLIEEQLRQIMRERVRNPTALQDAQLEFYQCICLAQSFFAADCEPPLWAAIRKLNRIRNEIAHSLEPGGLHDRIDDFVSSFPGPFHDSQERKARLDGTLLALFVAISDLVETQTAKLIELKRNGSS